MCKEKFKFVALKSTGACKEPVKSTGASSTAWKNCLQSQFNISVSLYVCKTYLCDSLAHNAYRLYYYVSRLILQFHTFKSPRVFSFV